jgi:SAM-dependent methyltransferase
MREILERLYFGVTRLLGRLSGRYYFEDYVRVYPDGVAYNRLGIRKRRVGDIHRTNFLNHQKFYRFAAQFVAGQQGSRAADIGCGSGYGCEILRQAGAAEVHGCDLSRQSIRFAKRRFSGVATFSVQPITDLAGYADADFDVTVCSEVLEHIKEYDLEDRAVAELARITRPGGIVVIGTPNLEMTSDHGFSFAEMDALVRRHFERFVIFENALLPFDARRADWEERMREGCTGVIVSQAIDLSETLIPVGVEPEVKKGIPAGLYHLGEIAVDTRLLHNTHSWAVVAVANA